MMTQKHIRPMLRMLAVISAVLFSQIPGLPTSGVVLPEKPVQETKADDTTDHEQADSTAQNTEPTTEPENDSPTQASDSKQEHVPSLANLLKISLEPVGQTMYVWGGGWNEEDTGAGIDAVTIGVSPEWKLFYDQQDSSYSHMNHLYEIREGLDCSGYIGWAVYNMFNTENNNEGYVYHTSQLASAYAANGWGTYIPASEIVEYVPGDILSSENHVYMVLGQYPDGSVLLVQSAPPGVHISGTPTASGGESMASQAARELMAAHYPDFYAKFEDCYLTDASFLTDYDMFRWNSHAIPDASSIQSKSPEQIIELLFG